jgi:hypothetical protein
MRGCRGPRRHIGEFKDGNGSMSARRHEDCALVALEHRWIETVVGYTCTDYGQLLYRAREIMSGLKPLSLT